MEKLDVMEVAAELARGVISNLPDTMVPDPTIANPELRAANLFQWEEFRIFHHGCIGALSDNASWPPPPDGDKIQVMKVAAKLTSGVMSNLPDTMALDPTIQDPGVRTSALVAWEIFRIFYHGALGALADNASWPAPPSNFMSAGNASPADALATLGKLAPVAAAGGPAALAAGIITKVAGAL
jgi:hypothetical protein